MAEEPLKAEKPEKQPKEAEKPEIPQPEVNEKPEQAEKPEVDELTTAKLSAIKKILDLGEKEGKGLEIVDFKAEKKEEKKSEDSSEKTEEAKKFVKKNKSIFITMGITLAIILVITFGAKNSGIIGGSVVDTSDEPITEPTPPISEESTDEEVLADEQPIKKELDEPDEEHEEKVDEHDVVDGHNASEQPINDNVSYGTVLNYLGQRLFGSEAEDEVEEVVEEQKPEDDDVADGVIGFLRGKLLSALNMNASES